MACYAVCVKLCLAGEVAKYRNDKWRQRALSENKQAKNNLSNSGLIINNNNNTSAPFVGTVYLKLCLLKK